MATTTKKTHSNFPVVFVVRAQLYPYNHTEPVGIHNMHALMYLCVHIPNGGIEKKKLKQKRKGINKVKTLRVPGAWVDAAV